MIFIFIDREAREIMYLVASVRPSVRPSADTLTTEPLRAIGAITSRRCLCVYNQSAYADTCADAVDRLLIKTLNSISSGSTGPIYKISTVSGP